MKKSIFTLSLLLIVGLGEAMSQCTSGLSLSTDTSGAIVGTNTSVGAVTYDWVVYDSGFNVVNTATTTDMIYTPTTSGTYSVCVSAYDQMQNWCDSSCSSITVTIDTTGGSGGGTAQCEAIFTLSTNGNGDIIGTNASTGSSTYDWVVYEGGTFNLVNSATSYDLMYTPISSGSYDVCLSAYDSLGMWCDSSCSSIMVSVDTSGSGGADSTCVPSFGLTANGQVINAINASSGASSFAWEVYDTGFNLVNSNTTNDLSYTVTASGTYNVCLNAFDTLGSWCDSVCDVISITVDTTATGIDESISSVEFEVFPNPAKDYVNIVLGFDTQVTFDISIVDVMGRQVIYLNDVTQNSVVINTTKFSSGVYTVAIKSNNTTAIQRFVKE